MTVNDLLDDLNDETGYDFAHFAWSKAPAAQTYGTVSETEVVGLWMDNHKGSQRTTAEIDLFTRDDTGAPKTAVEGVLDSLDVGYSLDFIDYEEETGFIHYVWEVSFT